jgi:hypothetical protein
VWPWAEAVPREADAGGLGLRPRRAAVQTVVIGSYLDRKDG